MSVISRVEVDRRALTVNENELADLAGDVAIRFKRLPQLHPSDEADIVFHVHAIQNIILSRAAFPLLERQQL